MTAKTEGSRHNRHADALEAQRRLLDAADYVDAADPSGGHRYVGVIPRNQARRGLASLQSLATELGEALDHLERLIESAQCDCDDCDFCRAGRFLKAVEAQP